MPPSQLAIATSSLSRLLKEEASYHRELAQQKTRIEKLEATKPVAESNEAYQLKQEKKALEETKAVFPSLGERIANAKEKLQNLLADNTTDSAEVEKAREVLKSAEQAQRDDSRS